MTPFLPTEHLSPTQLQAYTALESNQSVQVQSASFIALIDILNLLIIREPITIACDLHTKRLLEDYQVHHSLVEPSIPTDEVSLLFQNEMTRLKEAYAHSYPINKASLSRQYKALLEVNGLSIKDEILLHPSFKDTPDISTLSSERLETIIASHKKTWVKYIDIDPLNETFYSTDDSNSLQQYLNLWINTVRAIKNGMQKGLQQIVDAEKLRLESIKKEVTQHLINYQHHQSRSELDLIKKKMGFIMSDLPKSSFQEFTDLVMFALSNWESATQAHLKRYSKRFNSRNHESALIQEGIQELKVVRRDIENNGYLKLEIASHPLSYETQILQVEDLLQQLQYASHWLVDEKEFIEWKRFYSTLEASEKSIINTLTSLDAIDVSKQLAYINLQSWKDESTAQGIPSIDQSIALFEAYKNISATINWSHVNLISESSTSDYHLSYDGVTYRLTNVYGKDAISNYQIKDKELYSIQAMVTLDYYGQSNQAKNLATALAATQASFRTFQSKSLNIISCLDEYDNIEMMALLSKNNINELKGESIYELVKGSILDEGKEKIIIVYDELVNVQQTEHYFWQRLVLQSMSTAGYKVISINTSDVFDHIDLTTHLAPYLLADVAPYSI